MQQKETKWYLSLGLNCLTFGQLLHVECQAQWFGFGVIKPAGVTAHPGHPLHVHVGLKGIRPGMSTCVR